MHVGPGGGLCSPHIWSTNPTLRVWTGQQADSPRLLKDVYSTTMHELAHAGHWDRVGSYDFSYTHTSVQESWARGVQWHMTRKKYPNYVMSYHEITNSNGHGPYSGVVQDLMDLASQDHAVINTPSSYSVLGRAGHTNLSLYTPPHTSYPSISLLDLVGQPSWGCLPFDIATVQSAILTDRTTSWNQWRDQLKLRKPCGITDEQIDILFRGWYLDQ